MSMVDPPESARVPQDALSFGQLSRLMEAEAAAKQRIKDELTPPARRVETAFLDNLFGGMRDIFQGRAPESLEVVAAGIRDGVFGGIADAIRDAENLGERLIPIRDAARALISPVEDRVDTLSAEQLEVLERLVGLEDRRGFVQGYQSRNYQHGGGGAPIMTYWRQSGPAHGAEIVYSGLILNTPGVWTVHFQCFGEATSSGTGFGVRDEVTAELDIRIAPFPTGPVLRQYVKEVAAQGGTGKVSLSVSFPVVVPEGHTVSVAPRVYSARRRRFLGGERFSALSAVKRDVETGPQGEETVPDA